MVGPFRPAKGGFTHIFVAVDKFTKWIEAKPVASITAAKAVEFISEIIHCFGVMNTIITDNGPSSQQGNSPLSAMPRESRLIMHRSHIPKATGKSSGPTV